MCAHHWIVHLPQYVPETLKDPTRLFSKSTKITYSWLWGTALISTEVKRKKIKIIKIIKKKSCLCSIHWLKNCNPTNAIVLVAVCVPWDLSITWSSPVLHGQARAMEYSVTCVLPLLVGKHFCKQVWRGMLHPVPRIFLMWASTASINNNLVATWMQIILQEKQGCRLREKKRLQTFLWKLSLICLFMEEEKSKCSTWSQNPTGYFSQCILNLKLLFDNLFPFSLSALSPVLDSTISDYTVSFNFFTSDLLQLLVISLFKS